MKILQVLTVLALAASVFWLSACSVRVYPAPRQATVVERRIIVTPRGTHEYRVYRGGTYRRGP